MDGRGRRGGGSPRRRLAERTSADGGRRGPAALPLRRDPLPARGPLGGGGSDAGAINRTGAVVGGATSGVAARAFVRRGPTLVDLGTLSLSQHGSSVASGINDAGDVVGHTHTADVHEPPHAFLLRRGGTMQDLGTGYGPESASGANDVNQARQVVGVRSTGPRWNSRAVLWSGGRLRDLGTLGGRAEGAYQTESVATAVNDSGQVVGGALPAGTDQPMHAFLWQAGLMRDLGTLGGTTESTVAQDINEAGHVVGFGQNRAGRTNAFLWRGGAMRDLGALDPGFRYGGSDANALNDRGTVVGASYVDDGSAYGRIHAFVWRGGVMTDLNTVVALPPGVVLELASDINDAGVIVGRSCCSGSPADIRGFLLVPL